MIRVFLLAALGTGLLTDPAFAQDFTGSMGDGGQQLVGEGWEGFRDLTFLAYTFATLTLAALLGAVIAYHPRSRRAIDSAEEAEAPKTYITYAVVGAVIGLMVVQYGLVIGFVVFGIGGLIRFRTTLPSATMTGRLIFVTLIGLSAGLNLPHLAVLATAFGYGLIFVLDAQVTYSIDIQGLEESVVADAMDAYRSVLQQSNYHLVAEKQNPSKGKVHLVFRTSTGVTQEDIEDAFQEAVPSHLQGTVNWEVT